MRYQSEAFERYRSLEQKRENQKSQNFFKIKILGNKKFLEFFVKPRGCF